VTTVQVSNLSGGTSAAMNTVYDFTNSGTISSAAPFPLRVGPGQWVQINLSSGTTMPTAKWVLD
jgi:hypothetical protein